MFGSLYGKFITSNFLYVVSKVKKVVGDTGIWYSCSNLNDIWNSDVIPSFFKTSFRMGKYHQNLLLYKVAYIPRHFDCSEWPNHSPQISTTI